MLSRRRLALVAVMVLGATLGVVLGLAGVTLAQGTPPQAPPYQPGDTMPSSMFYWLVGIATTIAGSLVAAIKILWNRLNTQLKEMPCPIEASELAWSAERAELRGEVTRWQDRYFRQQTKMEKLAVRTQRAVEAVAGLEAPEVESDLDDVDQG